MTLGSWNVVPGCPGWRFGLRVINGPQYECVFDLAHEDGRTIEGLIASRYRTTALAKMMGSPLAGWEEVAVAACRELGDRPL